MQEDFFLDAVLQVPRTTKQRRSDLLNLSSNELLHRELDPIIGALLSEVPPSSITFYPSYQRAIDRLAEHHNVPASSLLLSAGSDDAIRMIIEAFSAPRRSIVLQVPNYEGWSRHAKLRGVQIREIRFGADAADAYTIRQFEECLKAEAPTVVAISNPNGPTGFTFDHEALAQLSAICARYGHLFVIDECYSAFASSLRNRPTGCADHEIRIQTMSKVYGLAGVRIATVIAAPATADYLARFRSENAVSGPALHLAERILNHEETISHLRRDIMDAWAPLVAEVSRIRPQWRPLPTEANFVNFRTSSNVEACSIVARLMSHGIRVRNVSAEVGLERCIRVSLAQWNYTQKFCNALEASGD